MEKCFVTICILYLFLGGCTSNKGKENSLIYFNVSASYPEKEVNLEDIATIEYLQLEVDEEFLFSIAPNIITENKIIFGHRLNGDILVFSRNGEPLSKFNRKGNGPGEYIIIHRLMYDEVLDEIFVVSANKIMVYSSYGEFYRSIPLLEQLSLGEIVNYDSQTFLMYDYLKKYPAPFSLISKEDGSVIETIDLPVNKNINSNNIYVIIQSENSISLVRGPAHRIVKYNDGYLLTDFSTDTLYFLSSEKKLSPILTRTPAIQSMEPVVYLNGFVEAGNHEFASTVTVKYVDSNLPVTYLLRDKETGSVYRQKITFNDYKGKNVTISPEIIVNTHDSRLGFINLDLTELQDANHENKLSGRLKELVDKSDEDGNDIYMLLHFK